jgi:ribosome-associated protein
MSKRRNSWEDKWDDDEDQGPSKSDLKREMKALQELGEAIVKLSKGQLQTIPLEDEKLTEAIHTARRIKSREGLRRQLQYIGKLLRNIDIEPIQQAHQNLLEGRKQETQAFHKLEQLRDQLIENGPNQLGEIIEQYPNADRQHLRQLIMQANKEQKANKPPAAARKLFKYMRELAEI